MSSFKDEKLYRELVDRIVKNGGISIPREGNEETHARLIGLLKADASFDRFIKKYGSMENAIGAGRDKISEVLDSIHEHSPIKSEDNIDDYVSVLLCLLASMEVEFAIDLALLDGKLTGVVPYLMWNIGYRAAIDDINKLGGK